MAAEVIVVPIPHAFPAIFFEGTWENAQEIIEWVKKHNGVIQTTEFRTVMIGPKHEAELRITLRELRGDIRIPADHWLVKLDGVDSYHVLSREGIHIHHTIHMGVPKEVPVAAGQ